MALMRHADRIRRATSAFMTSLTAICTLLAVGILLVILAYIAFQGIGSLSFRFLIDSPRPVGEGGGIGNAILGSLVLLGLSSAFGLPLGISVGIYLSEVGKGRFAGVVRFIVDALTGVPSIVTGVFVYAILVLPMKHFSAFAGGVALALIMIPIVARTTEEMLKLVPHSLREGALALGAPQWRVTLGVILPAAASGIATGAMLAIARVSGETAPLLFTAFGSRFFSTYLDRPIASLTVQIYNYALSPYDEWHAQAWAATLVLMTLILGINIIVRFLTRKRF
ncbi:MAG TPA: phosphate ABC transporter permease PstA [Pyrinomonadaceae bacterium]|jgi:phosphate ABC transporter, permease protein PstA|nr:phosphate ABC transporter permease PstA [Pyrinomonadaceae bacterium]